MALKATIYKASLQVADMDRHHYGDYGLTIARHPSETDERMMVRLLAFALHADEALAFGRGISTDDEPDLWHKDLTGAIKFWIEVGQPDERRLLKACGRADQVIVYSYSHASSVWWSQLKSKVDRAPNLRVLNLPATLSQEMADLAERSMQLQCTVQDGQIWLSTAERNVSLELQEWKPFSS